MLEDSFRKIKIGALVGSLTIGNEVLKKNLASLLIDMRGIPAKFAQMKALSNSEEAELWKEAVKEITPLPHFEIEEIIKSTNPIISNQIHILHDIKARPASIGQVHKAKLEDGNFIAIKVRYPGIDKQLLGDIDLMGIAGKIFSMLKEGFSLVDYQKTILEHLEREINYVEEVRVQTQFYEFFKEHSNIIIPKIYNELCAENLITQEWIEAEPADDFLKTASIQEKSEFSDLISKFYFLSLFDFGIVHADPNPGNFAVIRENKKIKLVIYDFGAVYKLSQTEIMSLWAMIENQSNPVWDNLSILGKLGFDTTSLKKIETKIPAYLSVIFEPFLSNIRFDFKTWNRMERCNDILGPDKYQFMISAPAHFFPVLRAFQGIFVWCQKSSGDLWLNPLIFETRIRLNAELNFFSKSLNANHQFISTSLRIIVLRNGEISVSLTLPRNSVEQLENLIEPELKEKIQAQNIDINKIQKKARENGYMPMILIEWKDESKGIKIFLE